MTRADLNFTMEDRDRGKVQVRIIDRITPDDIILHLLERELFKLAGGPDPGNDINVEFKDFIVKSGVVPGS